MVNDNPTTFSCEMHGENILCSIRRPIDNCDKILLFCHGFPGVNRLINLEKSFGTKTALIEINYRGDKASGGYFSLQGCIEDIQKVAQTLQDKYRLPIYGLGYSAGGCYVLNVQKNEPNLFQEIILLNPLVDTGFFMNSLLMKELWQSAKEILSLKSSDFYREEIQFFHENCNPMNFLSEITIPISLIQSREDEVLPPKTAQDFFSKLKCPKQWGWIPTKGHDLDGGEKEIHEL